MQCQVVERGQPDCFRGAQPVLIRTRGRRWLLTWTFGMCDGLAVVIGFALNGTSLGSLAAHEIGPVFAFICGVYLLLAAGWNRFRTTPRLAFLLPLFLSLDNLAYGISAGPQPAEVAGQAIILGAASFAMAMAGLTAGGFIRWPNPRTSKGFAGFALLAASVYLFAA